MTWSLAGCHSLVPPTAFSASHILRPPPPPRRRCPGYLMLPLPPPVVPAAGFDDLISATERSDGSIVFQFGRREDAKSLPSLEDDSFGASEGKGDALLDGSEVGDEEVVAVTVDAKDNLEDMAGVEGLPPPNDQSVDGHSLTAASIIASDNGMGKDEAGSDLADVNEIMIKPGNESEMAQLAPGIDGFQEQSAQLAPGIDEFQEQSDLTSDALVGGNESSASQEERSNGEPSEVVGVSVRNNDGDVGQSLKSGDNGSPIAGTFQTVTLSESSEEVDGAEILDSQEDNSFLPHKSSPKEEDEEVEALEAHMASVSVDRIVTTPAMQSELVSLKKLITSSGAASLPHPSKALSGGEDSYFVACENWFGVADGVGQWSLEGINAGLYARELMENCAQLLSKWEGKYSSKPEELLVESAKKARSLGSSTALVAHFDNEVLHVANLGDSGFVIVRNGATFSRSTPMVYGFNFPRQIQKGDDPSRQIERYRVGLVEGDVIVTGTDGLFDNIYDQEIASIVSKSLLENLTPKEIADILAIRAQAVGKSTSSRTPFADSAQAAGYTTFTGGKLDDVTVVVSLVVSSNKQ